jgi:hypothetical protein
MFNRVFLTPMRYGSRVLFVAALVMLAWGVLYAARLLLNSANGPSLVDQVGWIAGVVPVLHASFAPAAYLFLGALITHQLEQQRRSRDEIS